MKKRLQLVRSRFCIYRSFAPGNLNNMAAGFMQLRCLLVNSAASAVIRNFFGKSLPND
jgi:hypothetical protein